MKATMFLLFLCLVAAVPLSAQDTALPDADHIVWDVFIHNDDADAATELVFINMLTGEMNSLSVVGERFTLLGKSVIYYAFDEDQVKLATPDGSIQDHPFLIKSADSERVDWVVSREIQTIAWTVTRREDGGAISTSTYVSDLDGANKRAVLVDGPRDDLRVLPIAFMPASNELIMEVHPDGISDLFSYTQYAGLFALNLAGGTLRQLPDDSGCYCAAGFGKSLMLRMKPSASADNIDAVIHKFDPSEPMAITGATPVGFTMPGEALVSADDSMALYVVSQVPELGDLAGETRSVFVLADLQTAEQSLVSNPITGLVHTIAWTEDNGAVLFTSDQQIGTWKLRLSDGKITELASALYLGRARG